MVSRFRAAIIIWIVHKIVCVHCAMLLWLNMAIASRSNTHTHHTKKLINRRKKRCRNTITAISCPLRRKSEDIRQRAHVSRAWAWRQPQLFQPQNLHCIRNSIVLCARTFFIRRDNVFFDWCMFRLFDCFAFVLDQYFVCNARLQQVHTDERRHCTRLSAAPMPSFSHSNAVKLFRTMLCTSKYQTVENL